MECLGGLGPLDISTFTTKSNVVWDQAIKCKIIQELNMNKLTYALKVHMQVHARGEGQGDC